MLGIGDEWMNLSRMDGYGFIVHKRTGATGWGKENKSGWENEESQNKRWPKGRRSFKETTMAPLTKGCSTPSPSPSLAKDLSQFSAKSSPAFRRLQIFKSRNQQNTSLKPPQKLLQTMSLQTSPSGNHFTIGVNPGAHPDHLVILVNGIIGRLEREGERFTSHLMTFIIFSFFSVTLFEVNCNKIYVIGVSLSNSPHISSWVVLYF